jgi:hypothetical protein
LRAYERICSSAFCLFFIGGSMQDKNLRCRLRRSILALSACLGLFQSANGAVNEIVMNGSHHIEIQLDGLSSSESFRKDQRDFTKLQLLGAETYAGKLFKVGNPDLPVMRFITSSYPQVETSPSMSSLQSLKNLPSPVLPPRIKTKDVEAQWVFDEASYQQNDYYPSDLYSVEEMPSIRGQQRYMVTIHPARWNRVTNEIRLQLNWRISWEDVPVTDEASGFAFVVGRDFQSDLNLRTYMDHKRSLGYQVHQINMSDQLTTADQVRAELQNIYNNSETGLRHVLIVGDIEHVPSHRSSIIAGVTDHYYAAIDTDDYMSDIGGPDVSVGRLSAGDSNQLETIISKHMRYENGAFQNEQWLESIAFIATDDRYQVAEASHNYAIETYTKNRQYKGIFPAANQQGGDQLYAITHSVSDQKVHEAMDLGRTIINYSGHGSKTSWAGPNVSQANVRAMTDRDALPFVISNACITADFRVSESFGETWQRHDAGSIVFWGSMDSSYWDEDDILERAMYDRIFAQNQLRFDDVTTYALEAVWRHYGGAGKSKYYWETYHILGDASQYLRSMKPSEVSIEASEVIALGSDRLEVTVMDARSQPIANIQVGATAPSGLMLSAITDERGLAEFTLAENLNMPETISFRASTPNGRLAQSESRVVPMDTPFITIEKLMPQGRDEQTLQPRESTQLDLVLKNVGRRSTSGVSIAATVIAGAATLTASHAEAGALGASSTSEVMSSIALSVSESAQPFEMITLRLDWSTSEGQSGRSFQSFTVKRAAFLVESVVIEGAEGAARGRESSFEVTIKNIGNMAFNQLILTPSSDHPCVAAISGQGVVDGLQRGAQATVDGFTVIVSQSCPNGTVMPIKIQGTYDGLMGELRQVDQNSLIAGMLITGGSSENFDVAVPDNAAGVEATLNIERAVQIIDIGVSVEIEHTYIGDLSVDLVSPEGQVISLHQRAGSGADNLIKIYGMNGESVPELSQLLQTEGQGTWTLRVEDHASSDLGRILGFGVEIKGYWAD